MKKYGKMLITAIVGMLFATSVNAKMMTAEELGHEAEKIAPNARFIYVIGRYAYTSSYENFNIQDVMLAAADSVTFEKGENIKDSLKDMTMYAIDRTYNENYDATGWKLGENEIGNGTAFGSGDAKVDIRYIDYQVLAEDSEAEISLDIDNEENATYKEGLEKYLSFTTDKFYGKNDNKIKLEEDKVKGLLLKKSVNDISFNQTDKELYKNAEYFLATIVKVPGANKHTTITVTNLKGISKTSTWDDFDVQDETPGMFGLLSFSKEDWKNSNDKQITITVDIDGSGKEYNPTTYTLDLSALEFQEESKPSVTLSDPTTADKTTLDSWQYDSQINRELSLENGVLTGVLVEQKLTEVAFGANNTEGFYFDFKFTTPADVTREQIQIESLTGKDGDVKKKYSGFDEENNLTILFRFPDTTNKCEAGNSENCKLYFRVDYDGEGEKYLPTIYEIDYSQVEFEKNSKFSVTKELPTSAETNIKKTFEGWGFKPEELKDFATYKEGFNITEIDPHNVKISGLLPLMKLTNKDGFGEEATQKNGYYFIYVIKTDVSKTNHNGLTVKVPQNGDGLEPTKVLDHSAFDTDHEMAILMQLNPNAEAKQFKVIVDMDGEGKEYAPYEIIFDYEGVEFQQETISNISLDESKVPDADKATLTEWGYQFPNTIELSKENSKHTQGDLVLSDDNKLKGTVKEQKLSGGGFGDDADSYFFSYTIEPNEVKDTIEVTVKDVAGETSYDINDFTENSEGKQVLTILHHISKENASQESEKKITITIDADGEADKHYTTEEFEFDYTDVDFVELHDVKINDNNGTTTETIDVYDGEKLTQPATPEAPKHDEHETQYNTFDHWNIKANDEYSEDKEYHFTEEVTEDITLYPIWEIDVEQYMNDVVDYINTKDNVKNKFKIEKEVADGEEQHKLKIKILNKEQKIDEITDTGISSAIAHALASGEIDTIEFKGTKEKEFKKGDLADEDAIKAKVESDLKEFIKEELGSDNKTLDDLYTAEKDKDVTITIFPKKDVAVLPGKEEQTGMIYHIDFKEELKISFDAGVLTDPDAEYVKTGESIDKLPTPVIPEEEQDYREFVGWYKSDNTKVESLDDIKEDTTLTAHYELNVEKFVEDVVKDLDSSDTSHSKDFSSKFDIKQNADNKNEIEIDLKGANLPLNELAETSIPGTIAYILEKGEIKDITLGFENGEKKFSNETKEEVITKAKELFNEKLSGKEAQTTLDQLEYKAKEFTIEIGDVKNDTVKLVDSNGEAVSNKTYTFKFNSDFVVVDAEDNLGAQKISEVLDKDYSTIYVDSDITEADPITINKDITIESIENIEGISLAADTQNTITVNNQDTVIDVQNGNVTLKDLKLTGGKKSELKVEKDATVTVENIDVSGDIEIPTESKDSDEMHANILVEGKLTVTGTITNDNESYKKPTIALVKHWAHPGNITGEDDEVDPSKNVNVHPEASVTATGLTHNDRYHIIQEIKVGVDSTVETYYGDFYYVNAHNSEIYYMAINDLKNDPNYVFSKIKVYYYGDEIDFEALGYKSGEKPVVNDEVFDNFTFDGKIVKAEKSTPNQLGFKAHNTNMLVAKYTTKPSMSVNLQSGSGLAVSGNKISGLIETETNEKYIIPLTLTSEKFQDNKTTVKITNPNGETETKIYSANNENGIAPVSVSTPEMKLNLEAIKSTKITGNNGKVYTIELDVDGADTEFETETYTIDYSEVETLEEKINKAAENTHNANSFTVKKNNKINNYIEHFTYEFNKDTGLTHLKSENGDNVEEYSFSLKYVGKTDSKVSVVVEKRTEHEEGKVYLNDWEYLHPQQVGTAIHEVTMLTDVMGQTYINAIDKVQKVDGKEHTYLVSLNRDRYNDWIKKNYLSNPKYSSAEWALNETMTLEVELDDNDKYIKSIKTSESSSNNIFDVTFEKINSTTIDEPKKILATDGKVLTDDDITDFYNKGVKWWEEHTGATVYSE